MIDERLVAAAVARAKREIRADIASGRVPAHPVSFAQLHDFVDANEYGGLCDEDPRSVNQRLRGAGDAPSEAWAVFGNAVQDRLDAWIKAGMP